VKGESPVRLKRTGETKCTTTKVAKTGSVVKKKDIWNPIRRKNITCTSTSEFYTTDTEVEHRGDNAA
jgi:hypothetical protein